MKKEKISLILICLGILLFALAELDIISIITDILERILHIELYATFFDSFFFRFILIIIGGILVLVGGISYKNRNDK